MGLAAERQPLRPLRDRLQPVARWQPLNALRSLSAFANLYRLPHRPLQARRNLTRESEIAANNKKAHGASTLKGSSKCLGTLRTAWISWKVFLVVSVQPSHLDRRLRVMRR